MSFFTFFFPKKRKLPKYPKPVWLRWLFAMLLFYGVFKYYNPRELENSKELREVVNKTTTTLSADNITTSFKDYRNLIFPNYYAALELKDLTPGEGMPAVCGQDVRIVYNTTVVGGDVVADNASIEAPRSFTIGEGQVIPALDQGIIGMRAGGTRNIVATLKMAYGIEKFARAGETYATDTRFSYGVELIEASPALPDIATTPFRIFDAFDNRQGKRIYCADKAHVKMTLWSLDGKKLYSSQEAGHEIRFTTGKSEVFLGLEQGVIGMSLGSTRTLIVPPAFQKTMRGNTPVITFPFPKEQTVLVDIEALP